MRIKLHRGTHRHSLAIGLLLIIGAYNPLAAQGILDRPDSLSKPRVVAATVAEGLITASTLTGLQFAWYQQYDQQSFRFFNDWEGWMQIDKTGHAVSTYQIASQLHRIHLWTGMNDRSSRWLSSGLAFGYLAAVEVMDGFSEGWGFSLYDFGFNTTGVTLFHVQDALWQKQLFKLKFSFSPSGLNVLEEGGTNRYEAARARELFGSSLYEQWLKDYNGQTHWLNGNLWHLTGKPDWMPKWIDLSVGYSANGMLGAEANNWFREEEGSSIFYQSDVVRERQLLLSLDLNLDHVDLPKGLIWLRPVVHFIKLPFPALELNSNTGLGFRPLYF